MTTRETTHTAHPIDVHVGGRVRERRRELKMSQQGLGDAVDLTFQQIQKYERGANRISASKLYEISSALDVSVSYFFHGLPGLNSAAGHTAESNAMAFVQSSEGVQLAASLSGLSAAKRRFILNTVKGLVGLST